MIVGIVGKGPDHVKIIDGRRRVDCLIGINHAAAWHCCDWWCFGDMETWRGVTPLGDPKWFTNANAVLRIRKRGGSLPTGSAVWEQTCAVRDTRWQVYSATAALILARHLGADSILCFGVVDADPQPNESQRFATEREIWNATVQWLGLPVTRA